MKERGPESEGKEVKKGGREERKERGRDGGKKVEGMGVKEEGRKERD